MLYIVFSFVRSFDDFSNVQFLVLITFYSIYVYRLINMIHMSTFVLMELNLCEMVLFSDKKVLLEIENHWPSLSFLYFLNYFLKSIHISFSEQL